MVEVRLPGLRMPDIADPVDDTMRDIDQLDAQLIRLWQIRAELTHQLVKLRTEDGRPAYCHADQLRIVGRYQHELGPDGAQLAQLLLRHALQG